MRVLVVSKMAPWPPDSGGRVRLWNLLRRLSAHAEVMVVAFGEDDRAVDQARAAGFDLLLVPPPKRPSGVIGLLRRVAGSLWGPPTEVAHWKSDAMTQALAEAVDAFRPDLLQVEFYQMLQYGLEWVSHLPVSLTVIDIGWVPVHRAARLSEGLKRVYLARQARRTRRFEVAGYNRLRAVWVMSELDASVLQSAGVRCPSRVIPNGVAVDEIAVVSAGDGSPRALFVGSARHMPNVDALQWYLTQVHPLVRSAVSKYTLDVVGMSERQFPGPHPEGVEWHGVVPDVAPHYDLASVVVAPLRVGGGTRIKILEAMAYGVPVVSTSVGIEGIQADTGIHYTLADDPQVFAAAVCDLVTGSGREMSSRARELVETQYSWDSVVNAQIAGYSALLKEGKRGA
jgi:glycosyltransferase involved in cell wall biosynthesis